ncbi:MAG: A/G-specific adenine glycosylase [Flavobacteriales bacterium]
MTQFSEQIRQWYLLNFRKLPWRETKNPYKIWVSEVILQQTRVNQGLEYYNTFISEFPTVKSLAEAREGQVLKIWQGLGYYSRARNMHKAAKQVMRQHKGKFPMDYDGLIGLPGIGPYTAAAISSFASNEIRAVVDGNVLRVLARYFLIEEPVNSLKGKKIIDRLADELIDKNHPGDHNQAIMELGALVCTPKPVCPLCPVSETCQALRKKKTEELPVKIPKATVRNRYIRYYFIHDGQSFLLRKRSGNDIWKGMFDLPSAESEKKIKPSQEKEFLKQTFKSARFIKKPVGKPLVHLLSHRKLYIEFVSVHVRKLPVLEQSVCIKKQKLKNHALPKPIENFFRQHLTSLLE